LEDNVTLKKSLKELERLQSENGSWPPSMTLVVPYQDVKSNQVEVFSDIHSIMGTATALMTLCMLHLYIQKNPNIQLI
jgi:hypothetical protein